MLGSIVPSVASACGAAGSTAKAQESTMAWLSVHFRKTVAQLALPIVAAATLVAAVAVPSTAHAKARWQGPFLILGPGYST